MTDTHPTQAHADGTAADAATSRQAARSQAQREQQRQRRTRRRLLGLNLVSAVLGLGLWAFFARLDLAGLPGPRDVGARAIELVANDAKSGMDFALAENTEEQSRFAHEANVEARRLNRLVSFFFPLATLVAVFGMNPPPEVLTMPGFWLVILAGILAGLFIQIVPRGGKR